MGVTEIHRTELFTRRNREGATFELKKKKERGETKQISVNKRQVIEMLITIQKISKDTFRKKQKTQVSAYFCSKNVSIVKYVNGSIECSLETFWA